MEKLQKLLDDNWLDLTNYTGEQVRNFLNWIKLLVETSWFLELEALGKSFEALSNLNNDNLNKIRDELENF